MGALKTVMAITPDDPDADEPVVPEQMYALNQGTVFLSAHGYNRGL